MMKFIGTIALFCIPLSFVFVLPAFVWYHSREYEPLSRVLTEQARDPETLFGSAYATPAKSYKQALLGAYAPVVVAVGTSRVMEFRSSFFARPGEFRNLGGIMASPADLADLASRLATDAKLRVMIFGLDQRFFNPDFVSETAEKASGPPDGDPLMTFLAGAWRQSYIDYAKGRFTLSDLARIDRSSRNIGLTALVLGDGFLPDGSYVYHSIAQKKTHRAVLIDDMTKTARDVHRARGSFQYGREIDETKLAQVNAFLRAMQERGVIVIGFLPPYSTIVADEIDSVPDAYMRSKKELPKKVEKVFRAHDFAFFDLTNPAIFGSSDTEFIDSTHGSDKAYARIAIYLATHAAVLAPHVDTNALTVSIKRSSDDFLTR